MMKSCLIIGAGGHAGVLLGALEDMGINIKGLLDNNLSSLNKEIRGHKIIGNDNFIEQLSIDEVILVNGLGTIKSNKIRKDIFEKFKSRGFQFFTIIHPTAYVSRDAMVKEGSQILVNAIIQAGSVVGENCIINNGAIIEHNCIISGHVHIASGAVISGGVVVGENSHIGTGAKIVQGLRIGKNCTVGAGSVVTNDIEDGWTVVGVPARKIK